MVLFGVVCCMASEFGVAAAAMAGSSDLSSADELSTPPRSPPGTESVNVATAYSATGASSITHLSGGSLTTFAANVTPTPPEGERKKRKYVRKAIKEEKPAADGEAKIKKTRKPRAPK